MYIQLKSQKQRCLRGEVAQTIILCEAHPIANNTAQVAVLIVRAQHLLPSAKLVDAMPAQALQLSGHHIGLDHSHTPTQSRSYGGLAAYKSAGLSLPRIRQRVGLAAAYVRKSNLQVAAASYTSLSPTNGAARPASSSETPPTQPLRSSPPVVDHSKATIKVQQRLLTCDCLPQSLKGHSLHR